MSARLLDPTVYSIYAMMEEAVWTVWWGLIIICSESRQKDRTRTAGVRSRSKLDLSILRTNTGQQRRGRKRYVCVNMFEGKHTHINKGPSLLSKADVIRWPVIRGMRCRYGRYWEFRVYWPSSGHLIQSMVNICWMGPSFHNFLCQRFSRKIMWNYICWRARLLHNLVGSIVTHFVFRL